MSHFSFSYRLTQNTKPTDCHVGYSFWHLTAAHLVCEETARRFIESANGESTNTLLDDLREGMSFFSSYYERDFGKFCPHAKFYGWPEFQKLTAWKTPVEICLALRAPFLATYPSLRTGNLHPVIRAFVAYTERVLENNN